jgi:hypothetical protein
MRDNNEASMPLPHPLPLHCIAALLRWQSRQYTVMHVCVRDCGHAKESGNAQNPGIKTQDPFPSLNN